MLPVSSLGRPHVQEIRMARIERVESCLYCIVGFENCRSYELWVEEVFDYAEVLRLEDV